MSEQINDTNKNKTKNNSKAIEKTQVADIDRSIYDIRNDGADDYRFDAGLSAEIVERLSREKNDPEWMREFRLRSLEIYNRMEVPDWGPDISGLDMEHIATYVRPKNNKMQNKWENVPEEIRDTFTQLGIPEAEHKYLAGVGAQYDSELVYHNVRKEVEEQGVVYMDFEGALHSEYEPMIREHFMHLVPPEDHKFAALHGAVWSGGSFVYVPKGVSVEIPLQSYFRLNAKGAGQFEHTLIIVDEGADLHFIEGCSAPRYNVANLHAGCVELFVRKNARLRYSTIENWSKNMYNLNTKRAIVEEGGKMEWVSGSFGSHVSYLYPMTILQGAHSHMEFTGITFAGNGQNLDTGAKVVHTGADTSSYINTKSISKDGGVSTFRSSVVIGRNARRSKASVSCESLMLDSISRSDTIPAMEIYTSDADVGHEAQIGRISDEAVFYLMSRGISEEEARAMIVSGFADNVSKELPLEYAVEMNNLIRLEMKGSIG
ncbi:MAG: Fe-S cluster assembly protein SufB [Lachnospiraceae bacterium]|nr:Fe-S cluster assembly protein SufB [Lachnospiraceae bacterium]